MTAGGNVLLGAVIAVAAACAAAAAIRRARKGSACCGPVEAAPARVPVRDRRRSHYPYRVQIRIGGMTCANCARRVENALNVMEGTWARVDIATKTARVLLKAPPDERAIRDAIRLAGYTALSVEAQP